MSLRELMRKELSRSKEADPHVVAQRLLLKLPAEVRDEALLIGLQQVACEEVRFARMHKAIVHSGPSRRSVVMRERVSVSGEWVMLDDCDVDDLLHIADEYARQSELLDEKEREFRQLADELKRSGCATVGEMRARTERRAAA